MRPRRAHQLAKENEWLREQQSVVSASNRQ
jgi:hypothetical protein